MYTKSPDLLRMLVGGLVGIISIGGWGVLSLGVLGGIFGSQPDPVWILLGLMAFISGPFILGIANKAQWPRAILVGLLSPAVAVMLTGGLFAFSSVLEWPMGALPFDIASMMVAVYVAVLIGTAELLTRRLTKPEIVRVLRGVSTALFIVFGMELFSNFLPAIIVGNTSEAGWVTWLVITSYAVLIGVNAVYFDAPRLPQENSSSNPATIICIGLNSLVLVTVVVARLLT